MAKNRHPQGVTNDLEYGRGGIIYEKCLETGKRQNPFGAKTLRTGGHQRPSRC